MESEKPLVGGKRFWSGMSKNVELERRIGRHSEVSSKEISLPDQFTTSKKLIKYMWVGDPHI